MADLRFSEIGMTDAEDVFITAYSRFEVKEE
jgi:hypothetical protein